MALHTWIASPYARIFPRTSAQPSRRFTVDAALNEQLSLQIGLRTEHGNPLPVRVVAAVPDGWSVRVRRVGFVPLRHHNTQLAEGPLEVDGLGHIPGYVPDPLFDEDSILLPPGESHAFWIIVRPGRKAVAGEYMIRIAVAAEGAKPKTHAVRIRLHDIRLKPRQNFPITHWFYADSILDWYKLQPFEAAFWPICERYVQNYADHGLDMLYAPVFTPPLDGVKRPTQLLKVKRTGKRRYSFDWTDVKRWIDMAKRCGIKQFEWTHPFTQWGVKHAIRIYEGQGVDEKLLWEPETGATSETYRSFLSQFLPELHRFLTAEKLLKKSVFHVSDEPHSDEDREHYRQARALLKELAPWMRVMDALTDIEYSRQGLTDMPVPSIRTALEFVAEGIPSWCYYCCGPRGAYLNRLPDTPLPKIAMHGFLFYRWPFKGFLHWGFNYWYRSQTRELIDPYTLQDGDKWPGWAYGDTFVVYSGPDGPIDSIRWEVFAESLQDYALLQTIGFDRDHQLLRSLKSFADFPKDEAWRRKARAAVFESLKE